MGYMMPFAFHMRFEGRYPRGRYLTAARFLCALWGDYMDLFLFRLSLKAKEIVDLFEARDADGRAISREYWLRLFFGQEREFIHYRNTFVFKPLDLLAPGRPHLRFGWVARELRLPERTPPSEGLEPTEHLSWQASFLAIDPTDHPNGQLIALEYNSEIGLPKALISSLVRTLNSDPDAPYFAQAFPLVETGSFWDFAKKHRDEIKSITFDVAAPNMFRDDDDFQEEFKSLRDGENVSTVKATLESDSLLNHKTERIRGLINYVERGAGDLYAEALDGSRYSSSEHEVKVTADIERPNRNLREFLRDIIAILDRIFP